MKNKILFTPVIYYETKSIKKNKIFKSIIKRHLRMSLQELKFKFHIIQNFLIFNPRMFSNLFNCKSFVFIKSQHFLNQISEFQWKIRWWGLLLCWLWYFLGIFWLIQSLIKSHPICFELFIYKKFIVWVLFIGNQEGI